MKHQQLLLQKLQGKEVDVVGRNALKQTPRRNKDVILPDGTAIESLCQLDSQTRKNLRYLCGQQNISKNGRVSELKKRLRTHLIANNISFK